MGDYMNSNQSDSFWSPSGEVPTAQMNYYKADYSQFENQQLEFQPMEEYVGQAYSGNFAPQMYDPVSYDTGAPTGDEFDEPPLLEELEIHPDRILEKILAVLNPFRGHSLTDDSEYLTKDADLAGPLTFCIVLAVCLFVSGNKAHFGYIYGISVISCVLMYFLLSLMTPNSGVFSLNTVASILGYCLIPVVGLSLFGLFLNLKGVVGILLAGIAVMWASVSASRLFVAVSGDKQQQPLIAYPCALVYGVYVLLVVF